MLQHCAIFLPGNTQVSWVLEQLLLGKWLIQEMALPKDNVLVFSEQAIAAFIEEEQKHDRFLVTNHTNQSLQSMSSGERKKAFLAYLLAQQPAVLILDNLWDNVDTESVLYLQKQLTQLSESCTIIQLFYRMGDLLPFVEKVAEYNTKGYLQHWQSRQQFSTVQPIVAQSGADFNLPLPPPLGQIPIVQKELIVLQQVNVQYDGRPILNSINWTIVQNSFWQLKGPNGAGKSTLLSMLNGDNPKGYGQNMWLFGRKKGSGESIWDIKKNIGYFSPQLVQQFERLDSIEQMVIGGYFDSVGLYLVPSELQIKFAQRWLQILGLFNEKHRPFRFFSPAQQRQILIVRAMVKHPPLLILDEPTAGLDDAQAATIVRLINKIAAESNTAIVYVSHRTEKGLQATQVYELVPGAEGSIGRVVA